MKRNRSECEREKKEVKGKKIDKREKGGIKEARSKGEQ